MEKPFFSIIIPTYNRLAFLETAIESVLKQTFKDFELLIIDDGSTDTTHDYIKKLQSKQIKYFFSKHSGVSSARNLGLKNAKGEFISFLDSDDWWDKDKLKITATYIEMFPDIKIFHTDEIWYRHGELLNQKKIHKKPDGTVFNKTLRICCISISTATIKKSVFKKIGAFDEEMPACEDYDFWLRVTSKYQVKLITKPLTLKEGGHPDQLSQKYPAMDQFRIYSIDKILQSGILNTEQKLLAITELKKKCRIYINGARKRNKLKKVNHFTEIMNQY